MDKVIIDGTEYKLKELPSYEIGGYHNLVISFRGKNYVAKAIKKEVEKDYEILKCINDIFGVHDYVDFKDSKTPCFKEDHPCKIHSVKRLSDNKVFSIGDVCQQGDIKKIYLYKHSEIFVSFSNGETGCDMRLNDLEKTKERIPLFYADNGKTPIYEGDEFWLVSETQFYLIGQTANVDYEPYYADKKFSTVQLANEYLLMNKPILSLSDLLSKWGEDDKYHANYQNAPLFLKFKELVKKKMNL